MSFTSILIFKVILIIKHIEIEGAGTLEEFFRQAAWKIRTLELCRGENLPALDECEAIIFLGGPMNVYAEDKYSFLRDEDNFLKKAIKEGIPLLGICLGAQLLAKAAGARVVRAAEKERGYKEVVLTADGERDLLFEGLPAKLEAFQWHEDTFEVPRAGVLLAKSSCLNQAFRFGSNAYGLQFHIEVTPPMIESWINKYAQEKISGLEKERMLSDADKKKEAFERQANIIYLNFARIIKLSRKRAAA